ncbi:YfiT family bacillithiol transferase [Bacillus salitolerans]|uniref:Putative metal-dependent hydrolase ACFSCX_11820 n=1 Tax=Bacillus salitolerans TaxID=1437434 RepID=A0ABW4LPX7_9BACI
MDSLRFPIGKYTVPTSFTTDERIGWVHDIKQLPIKLKQSIEGLTDEALNTPYREGGWTIRQVIHHLADSHMNSFIRFKLALTEDYPTIKTYEENKWAELEDSLGSVSTSLQIIDGLHERWGILLESLSEEDFQKGFYHPEIGRVTLGAVTALYSWHSRHHHAHIELAKRNATKEN